MFIQIVAKTALTAVKFRDRIGCLLRAFFSVLQADSDARNFQHPVVIVRIAERHDLRQIDAVSFAELLQRIGLVGLCVDDLIAFRRRLQDLEVVFVSVQKRLQLLQYLSHLFLWLYQ